ncbi:MAG: hypothetical protein AAF530_17900 [Pseudomonadota bacterium]
MKFSSIFLFALTFAFALDFSTPALAYLDPGTGAMFLQIILGGVAGAVVICKLYWQRFKAFFSRSASGPSDPVGKE